MIPARYSSILFSLILSGLMSCVVSGLATLRAIGPVDGILAEWMGSWAFCWPVAFAVVLVVAPVTRGLVRRMVRADA